MIAAAALPAGGALWCRLPQEILRRTEVLQMSSVASFADLFPIAQPR